MSILNPKFKYTSAAETDIRRTFRRVQRQLEREAEERKAKVSPIGAAAHHSSPITHHSTKRSASK